MEDIKEINDNYETRYWDIFRGAEDKECFVFGSGKYASHFLETYGRYYPIAGIIDNDSANWGKNLRGIEIASPKVLEKVDKDRIKVFVCVKEHSEIAAQLNDIGIPDYSIYDKYQVYPRSIISSPQYKKKYHVGYCAGAFDMFHVGHLNLLQRAKQMCDCLIVGVMSDQRVFDLKNQFPIIPCEERVKIVEGCRYVDRVEVLQADRAGIMDAYHMFHFDCMISGDDHINDPAWLSERDRLRELGSDLVFVSYSKETSSTEIRNRIKG